MRIAVVGAGIVGMATAWELAQDGHAVVVLEAQASVASEASFANAGVLAPGYVTPWAAPGMPTRVLAGQFSRHRAVRFGPRSLSALPWLWRFLLASRPAPYRARRAAMVALARDSVARLQDLSRTQELEFEQQRGYLVLLRSPRERDRAAQGLDWLHEQGIRVDLLDAAACRALEPGLHEATALAGGLHLPDDGLGNCRLFAHHLLTLCRRLGVEFRFGTRVTSLRPGSPVVVESQGNGNALPAQTSFPESFDAVVVCAGQASRSLFAPLGLQLPILPVHGYSITAPLREHDSGRIAEPLAGLMDERYKVAISRLGDRVRVAGSAEIGGSPDRLAAAPLRTLYKVLNDWFPGAATLSRVQQWKGGRPMTPDGPPLIGPSLREGIWLNTGHGSSGWALSCGSARLLGDQLKGATPSLDPAPFQLSRLGLR